MIQQAKQIIAGNPAWKPGQSGNPRGRPPGSRQKIAERVLSAVSDLLHTDAADASLRELMATDPGKFWTIATGLLPKEVEAKIRVQVAPPGNLDPEEWATLCRIVAIARTTAPEAPPAELFAGIEHYLRSEYARTIDHAPLAIEHQPPLLAPMVTAAAPTAVQIDIEDAIAAVTPPPPY